jgi:uncharacterized protein (TIGR03435 family)
MLRALLVERFGLALHHESKQMAGYALLVGKNGSKLTPSSPGKPADGPDTLAQGALAQAKDAPGTEARGHLALYAATVEKLAEALSRILEDRPILDLTNLNGTYNIALDFSERSVPAMSEAVEAVGLKLEPRRVPMDVLVVDRVARVPTPN